MVAEFKLLNELFEITVISPRQKCVGAPITAHTKTDIESMTQVFSDLNSATIE